MELSLQLEATLAEVRALPGFEGFLSHPEPEALFGVADRGPVVVVNVSGWRCDALLLRPEGVTVQELPTLTAADVADRVREYLETLGRLAESAHRLQQARLRFEAGERSFDASREVSEARRAYYRVLGEIESMLTALTEWMWDAIAGPVLSALGHGARAEGDTELPRLWWCPTGLLALLPLHAAGRDGDGVLDRVVPSTTPTLRALVEARKESTDESGSRLLLVTASDVPDVASLPNVHRERAFLTDLFAGQSTLLDAEDAVVERVRAELPRHRWVHFSCHGAQDLLQPSQGGLLLSDGRLTIGDISTGYFRGDFAYLSACQTATGGLVLPDEAITLTAALHYAGYRHVIGTLWSVYDEVAAEVTEAVYADLTSTGVFDPARSARALHRATTELRGRRALSAWVPFIHTGP
ncbi:CHAT domain-containing protein [Streptomyces sp. NPDC088794]|uniref:CHAT domain-containing protein n=1 Tax=Streptomyces sp. NPDC088794 TaxID=3365902 RepID=UPI003806E99D